MFNIKLFITNFKNNVFWRSVVVLVSGTAISQLLGLFTTPVISRLYDPNAFGEYAIIVSTATIIMNIVTVGLNSAIMVPKSDDEAEEVFRVTFFTMIFFATAILIILIIFSPFKHFFDAGMDYIIACILIYVLVVIGNLKGLLSIYMNRKRMNRVLFYNSLIAACITLFVAIPLGIIRAGSYGLILSSIFAGVITCIQMIYHTRKLIRIPNYCTFINVYKKYKDFIIFQYPSNFVESFAVQLPTQVFSSVFGNINLGSYSMNEKILGIPSRLIGAPINTIYFRTASEYSKEGKNLARFTFSLVTKIMLVALIPMLVVIMWGQQIFTWALGSEWSEAGRLAGFLIVQYMFMFCATCTSYCRVAIGKQKINLLASILKLVIIGCAIFLGINIYGDVISTIIFFTIGSVLYLIIDMAINFYCMGKYCVKYLLFAIIYTFVLMCLWYIKT